MLPEVPWGETGRMAMLVSVASVYRWEYLRLQQESASSSAHHSSIQHSAQHTDAHCVHCTQHSLRTVQCTHLKTHCQHCSINRQETSTASTLGQLHCAEVFKQYMHHIPCRHHSFKPETGDHHREHLDHDQEEHDDDDDHKEGRHYCLHLPDSYSR